MVKRALTEAQRVALLEWIGATEPGQYYDVHETFPGRSPRDRGRRRCIRHLAEAGILDQAAGRVRGGEPVAACLSTETEETKDEGIADASPQVAAQRGPAG